MDEFVGASQLAELQAAQLKEFRLWVANSNWSAFHENHYDWWAFPIAKPSAHGYKFTVTPEALLELRKSSSFLSNLSEAASLLMLSWGWDIERGQRVSNPDTYQTWMDWPIRLQKCHESLVLFELHALAKSVYSFAVFLRDSGKDFTYNQRDLFQEIEALDDLGHFPMEPSSH